MSKQIGLLDRLEDFINDYLPNVKGLSANTVKSYKDTFRLLIIYFEDKKDIPCKKLAFIDLNVENIKDFMTLLLKKDVFDDFQVRDIKITTFTTFEISFSALSIATLILSQSQPSEVPSFLITLKSFIVCMCIKT